MKRARGAALQGVVSVLSVSVLAGALCVATTARSQSVGSPLTVGREVLAQLGGTSGAERYRILYSLKAANRIASGLTVNDLNAIIVGMEDRRTRVISLMARDVVPNLSAADVVALSGQTSGSSRYRILYSLKAANRIASGLTVNDLNAIIVGMEDQRTRVISLMARDLVPNLSAADVVASGGTAGTAPAPGAAPPPAPPTSPGILGGCGSSKWQRFAVPEYVCFSMYGGTLPWVNVCSIAMFTGYKPVYLGEACRAHDDCYGSAGAKKSQCDQNFLSLLQETCDATLAGDAWTYGRKNCRNAASEFHYQVSTKGCSAFIEGQTGAGMGNPTCE